MTQYNYIKLKYSDDTGEKKFRVISEGYDDGTLNRSETVTRLIGGGLSHSVGATYKTWMPVIRVRHTEPETGYGTMADLEAFWSKNNPLAVPSMTIKFTDNHGTLRNVHFVGPMTKMLMGCDIEGNQAWFLYKLQLMEA